VNAAARARAEATETEVAEQRGAELEQELQDLDHLLVQRENARQGLDAALTNAATNLTQAQNLLRDIQRATAEAENLQAQANEKANQAEQHRKDIAQLRERDLPQAEQRATAAEEAYAAAQRHNAAAAAAHGLHVGDDCSVCNRPLPQDWRPPTAEDLDTARDTHQAAAAGLTEVRDNIRDLSTRSDIISTQAAELRQKADRCQEAARTAAALLAPLLGRNQIDLTTLQSADELLQPSSSAVARAGEKLAVHDAESQRLRDQRTAALTNLTNARDSLEKIRATYTRNSEEAAAATQAFRAALTSLPDRVQINVALPDDPLEIEAIHLGGIDEANRALSDRTQELDRRAQHRMQLQQQLDVLAEDIRGLDTCWADQVRAPGDELVATVNSHRDVLGDGITLLNIPDVLLEPAASLSDPTQLADLVRALHQATDAVTQRIHALVDAAQKDFAAARKTIDHLAAELAIPATGPHPADPEQVVARAEAEATEAEVEARAAQRTADDFAKLAAPLTRLRDIGEELNLTYKVLKDLSAALKPGAFPKWLTLRRSRALLVHASRLLEQMSGERYAFAELDDENAEWRIIDNDSGLARSPASLSGGEQFITSLALALGMVEMMARSGGRLESLWLDEGFGSLDRSNLDAAIEALASVAARGRMVAVISHVRAVADQVSHVLAVTREVTGTTAKWLDPNQRTQLATADIEDDFALSGLLD
jgi:exonuclease SbcC